MFLIATVIWRHLRAPPPPAPEPGLRRDRRRVRARVGAPWLRRAAHRPVLPRRRPHPRRLHRHRSRERPHHAPDQTRRLRRGQLLTPQVLFFGLALTPATLLGTWVGKKIVTTISDRIFVILVESASSPPAPPSSSASKQHPDAPNAAPPCRCCSPLEPCPAPAGESPASGCRPWLDSSPRSNRTRISAGSSPHTEVSSLSALWPGVWPLTGSGRIGGTSPGRLSAWLG